MWPNPFTRLLQNLEETKTNNKCFQIFLQMSKKVVLFHKHEIKKKDLILKTKTYSVFSAKLFKKNQYLNFDLPKSTLN